MSETRELLDAITSLSERGRRAALATIVAVRGSTYRRPGARMLVPEQGEPTGMISGGCLEGDVTEVARRVVAEDRPTLATWDLTEDQDGDWGLGVGCRGAIEVFFEPIDPSSEIVGAIRAAFDGKRPVAVATVIESRAAGVTVGARLVASSGTDVGGRLGDAGLDSTARETAVAHLELGGAQVHTFTASGEQVRVFVEVLEPPLRLVVCGAGHDAVPVVRAAAQLGWNAVVLDDRADLLEHDRFPDALELVRVERARDAASVARADERTFVVVMTHDIRRDGGYLRSFLDSPVPYLALLGPAERTDRLLRNLADEGIAMDGPDRARLHAPAGLDLGGETPEEIASAIVAEIVAVRRGRRGGFLSERRGSIHGAPEIAGTSLLAGD